MKTGNLKYYIVFLASTPTSFFASLFFPSHNQNIWWVWPTLVVASCSTLLLWFLYDKMMVRSLARVTSIYFLVSLFLSDTITVASIVKFSCGTCMLGPEIGFFFLPPIIFVLLAMVPLIATALWRRRDVSSQTVIPIPVRWPEKILWFLALLPYIVILAGMTIILIISILHAFLA